MSPFQLSQLWDVIAFTATFGPLPRISPFSITMWKTWLSRSGASPLTIKLIFGPIRLPPSRLPIVDMLISYSHRWQYFNIQIESPFTFDLFAAVKGSLPILRKLTIISKDPSIRALNPLATFEVAPNLKKLMFSSAPIVPTQCRVPWAHTVGHCFWARDFDQRMFSHLEALSKARVV